MEQSLGRIIGKDQAMIEKIKRQLDRIEKSMGLRVPKVNIFLAFVPPADDAQPVKYFRFDGMGKLERINRDRTPWEDDQR
jgi:hypothetical protein